MVFAQKNEVTAVKQSMPQMMYTEAVIEFSALEIVVLRVAKSISKRRDPRWRRVSFVIHQRNLCFTPCAATPIDTPHLRECAIRVPPPPRCRDTLRPNLLFIPIRYLSVSYPCLCNTHDHGCTHTTVHFTCLSLATSITSANSLASIQSMLGT